MTHCVSSRAVAVALVTFATFTDIVAYSVAVPVLPDLSRKLGASPTMIGLLFASFGVTLLLVSIPMGAVSDRIGRKAPLVGGLLALAAATLLFAYADGLPWLFAARLVQGAADAVTWVVGFALIADRYGPEERGRVSGIVMSGTSVGVHGRSVDRRLAVRGRRHPRAVPAGRRARGCWRARRSSGSTCRRRARKPSRCRCASCCDRAPVAVCAAVVVAISATLTMLEPVLPLFLNARLGLGPARLGLLFGCGAVASAILHPIYGRLADRWGGRRMMLTGLPLVACVLPLINLTWSYPSTIALLRAEHDGGGDGDHAVADLHGRGGVGGRRRIVRRRLRPLQHGVGRRPAGRPGGRRVSSTSGPGSRG